MKVIVDTGFLSSLAKIGRLDLPLQFFSADYFVIPEQVLEELKKSTIFNEVLEFIATEKPLGEGKFIYVKRYNLEESHQELGKGELACVEICQDQDLILMDDRKAKKFAREKDKSCCDLPTFLYACKKRGIIDQAELEKIIQDLKGRDYYEMPPEVRDLLLNNTGNQSH